LKKQELFKEVLSAVNPAAAVSEPEPEPEVQAKPAKAVKARTKKA
jgi:hypothetical protein